MVTEFPNFARVTFSEHDFFLFRSNNCLRDKYDRRPRYDLNNASLLSVLGSDAAISGLVPEHLFGFGSDLETSTLVSFGTAGVLLAVSGVT